MNYIYKRHLQLYQFYLIVRLEYHYYMFDGKS